MIRLFFLSLPAFRNARVVGGTFLLAALLTACTPEHAPTTADARNAEAFYAQNHLADLTHFEGVSVRAARPVVQRDVHVLGHVYDISFCAEVVDVLGYRGTPGVTFHYSDWPPMQQELRRRSRHDSVGRQQLAELFKVSAPEADAAFTTWAAQTVDRFKQLNPPRGAVPARPAVRALQACVSGEGHAVIIELTSGLELFYLPPDTENSLFWTKQRRQFQRLGPHWYWRRRTAPDLPPVSPTGR